MKFKMRAKKGEKKRKLEEKAVLIAIAVVLAATGIAVGVWANSRNKVPAAAPTAEDTGSVSEEPETQADSETQTEEETTKKPPVVKPVGTTKPVEKETNAPVKPQPKPDPGKDTGNRHVLDVPYINQREKYPTGCESITAVMALRYSGYSISPETYIDRYLPKGVRPFTDETGKMFGDDPRKCFLGNPYSESGWGCYAPVIEKGLNEVIDSSRHRVENSSGTSIKNLCAQYIDKGIPVIMWATQNMQPPKQGKTWYLLDCDETFTWISGNHCLLLVGYDNSYYYFNDPLQSKNYRYERAVVENRYAALGRQALAIVPYTPPVTDPTETSHTTETTTAETTLTVSEPENTGTTEANRDTTASGVALP